mmetsp:Transcript_100008/g.224103  ORF Transcript_100008/g.224103 Transcript_100008/m.224103 type:complete len:320 (+) Transcript_100008:203-1162(+)
MRRQVRRVNLELAPDRSLDGPTGVQAEAHIHAATGAEAVLQAGVRPVACEHRRPVDGPQDLREGHDGQFRHPLDPADLLLLHPPDDEEGLPVVLVRRPVELVRHTVDDLCDHVHEGVDPGLQNLRGHAEVADAADADDALHDGAGDHCVDADGLLAPHVVLDDVGASLAEAESEQGAELDDGLLQDQRLHGLLLRRAEVTRHAVLREPPHLLLVKPPRPGLLNLLLLELLVRHLRRHQRVVADGHDVPDHLLDGGDDELVRVVREHHRPHHQQDQEQEHGHQLIEGGLLGERPVVEVELQPHLVVLGVGDQLRVLPGHL